MSLARTLIAALVFVSLLPRLALAVMPDPSQPDSLATIKTQLSALADRYIAISPPTSAQVNEVKNELTNLSSRVRQLPDWPNPAAQELDATILQFRKLLPDPKSKAPQARTGKVTKPASSQASTAPARKRPETLQSINLPQAGDGGHTAKGVAFLKGEIDHFGARYRRIKNQDTVEARGADYEIKASRSTLERTIEAALDVAQEQIATKSYDESTIYVSTGVAYRNFSPRENLQWAYAVATLGIHFESQVGGKSADVWRTWQRKVRDVASKNRIKL